MPTAAGLFYTYKKKNKFKLTATIWVLLLLIERQPKERKDKKGWKVFF
jgi:hypothetical protein